MSEDPKRFTREQLKELTFTLQFRDQQQRDLVRQKLFQLHDLHDGLIYRRDLHLELLKMQETYEISDVERQHVEAALFG